ncbi:MAG TPA: hypothetical protein VGG27_15765 [Magnetospirillaceae bacterium]|jgi:hypothetical protein
MKARDFQFELIDVLREVLPSCCEVKPEWSVAKDEEDGFRDLERYAPRLDIATGPWNVTRAAASNVRKIHEAAEIEIIKRISGAADPKLNRNPRCLLAIEIEFSGSSKHILGGCTNASMMGAVGIVIGHHDNIDKIRRIEGYAAWLRQKEKSDPSLFGNVRVYETTEFIDLLHIRSK